MVPKNFKILISETCAGAVQTPKTTNYRRSNLNRSTLDFIFEDIHSDSTSVLKDRRHPSLSSVNLGTFKPETKLGRVVSFNRSHSSDNKGSYLHTNDTLKQRSQSFTSLMADLSQDYSGRFLALVDVLRDARQISRFLARLARLRVFPV